MSASQVASETIETEYGRMRPPKHLSHSQHTKHEATTKDLIDMVLYAEVHENYKMRYHKQKEAVRKFQKNVETQVKALQIGTIIYAKEAKRGCFYCWRSAREEFELGNRYASVVGRRRKRYLQQIHFMYWRIVVEREKWLFFPDLRLQERDDLLQQLEDEMMKLSDALRNDERQVKKLQEALTVEEEKKDKREEYKEYMQWSEKLKEAEKEIEQLQNQIKDLTAKTSEAEKCATTEMEFFRRLEPIVFDYMAELGRGGQGEEHLIGCRGNPVRFMQLFQKYKFTHGGAFLPFLQPRVVEPYVRRENHAQILAFWVNEVIRNQPNYQQYNRLVENWGTDMEDGMHFCYVLSALFPNICQFSINTPKTTPVRMALVFQAFRDLEMEIPLHHTDINKANDQLIILMWSMIYEKWTEYHKRDYQDISSLESFEGKYGHTADRVTHCCEHLENTYEVINDGNPSWDIIADHVTKSSMGSMLTMSRRTTTEDPYLPEFNRDINLYIKPQTDRIIDLLPNKTDEMQTALSQLRKVLHRNFKTIKGMFQFYSALPSQHQAGFGMGEFNKYILDIKLVPSKTISKGQLDVIMSRILYKDQTDTGKTDRLHPRGFIELLIRLANLRYHDDSSCPTLASRFNSFMMDHCIPYGGVTSSDHLKQQAQNPMLQNVLRRYHRQLSKIFVFFAADDIYDPSATTMNIREFASVWRDAEFIDKQFTRNDVLCLFNACQNNTEHYNEDSEMDFDEFLTGLVSMSLWKNPNPFVSDAIRMDRFLSESFIPAIVKKHPHLRVDQVTKAT
eukprot:TRINITY_DN47485_c0_g1_i1.p1 TRINITY_DN47485_c0_g1~~TRINITY_DN47485_c0_g1_i1.p1  ORF type:complete len:926 (+),score=39.15 TRINITY_DN47485_c0_g1_i1:409-2778(+)